MKAYLFLFIMAALIQSFSASSEYIAEAFLKNEIVPDVVKAAPKKIIYVSFFFFNLIFLAENYLQSKQDDDHLSIYFISDIISKWRWC